VTACYWKIRFLLEKRKEERNGSEDNQPGLLLCGEHSSPVLMCVLEILQLSRRRISELKDMHIKNKNDTLCQLKIKVFLRE
jgi:hypothetical protein